MTMTNQFSLKNRIVIGYTFQTLLILLLVYSTIGFYVDYIEESVLYEQLSHYLDAYIEDVERNQQVTIPSDISIFSDNASEIPEFARQIGPGGHEIVLDDGRAYHVLIRMDHNQRWTLIKDQTAFEDMEKISMH
jgi:hypothetical protein